MFDGKIRISIECEVVMKIVRLKSGYRISCSDHEMSLLRHMMNLAGADMEAECQQATLSPGEKRVFHSPRFRSIAGPLTVDEDRRFSHIRGT
jgi:hypothetical protein